MDSPRIRVAAKIRRNALAQSALAPTVWIPGLRWSGTGGVIQPGIMSPEYRSGIMGMGPFVDVGGLDLAVRWAGQHVAGITPPQWGRRGALRPERADEAAHHDAARPDQVPPPRVLPEPGGVRLRGVHRGQPEERAEAERRGEQGELVPEQPALHVGLTSGAGVV